MKKIIPVSEKVLKVRQRYFPFKIGKNITCEVCSREDLISFMDKNFEKVFPDIFNPKINFKKNSEEWLGFMSTALEYRKLHSEYFLFKESGKIIGWSQGEMEDFETFYMRNTGILPKHQMKNIYSSFLTQFLLYLKELGYQRVSSNHAYGNQQIINSKMKQGFVIVGTEIHDRWGNMVKLVKYLNPKREKQFKEMIK